MIQFSDEDNKAVSEFMRLLINLGMSSDDAYKNVESLLQKTGWGFVFFNDVEDFWVTDNELK